MRVATQDDTDTIYALANTHKRLYAARTSGLTLSEDSGVTWCSAFTALDLMQPLTVTAVIAHENSVFAGTNGAVLRSEDGGQTWEIIGLASPPPQVVALALSPNFADDAFIAAGTAEDGVFVSDDGGKTWIPWNYGLLDLHVYTLAFSPNFAHDQTLYAGTESGVFVSQNAGRGWRELAFPMTAAPVLSLAVSGVRALWAGTERHSLWRSTTQGNTWDQVQMPPLATLTAAVNALMCDHHGQIWALLDDRLLVSADGGATWQSQAVFTDARMAMSLTIEPESGGVWVAFADGSLTCIKR